MNSTKTDRNTTFGSPRRVSGVQNQLCFRIFRESLHTSRKQVPGEMYPGDVEVGKVSRVRFVKVVIDVVQGGVRLANAVVKQLVRTMRMILTQDQVTGKGTKDAKLCCNKHLSQ